MRNLIIARKEEQRMLQNLKNERTAQFLAVYGRRRVGKTFLIREYFEDSFTFKHTALSPLELKDINPDALYKAQLAEFKKSLVRYGHKNDSQISDWFEAFDRLRELIESKNANERVIAFIDEMPWMDTPRAGFMSALEHFWNDYGSGKHNLLLIACGSATTWMLDKLIHNQGGLYGRTTKEMHIHPFTLSECEEYYKSRGVMMDRYDILQSYMILGGVAYARIGNATYIVNIVSNACFLIMARHDLTISVTHYFNINALIARGRVTKITPQKSADFLFVARFH